MEYDTETRDLARLAADRVSSAIASVLQLCNGPDQSLQVTLMAAGTALGSATGAITAKYGKDITDAETRKLLFDLLAAGAPERLTQANAALTAGHTSIIASKQEQIERLRHDNNDLLAGADADAYIIGTLQARLAQAEEVIGGCRCPRPANHRPDEFTVAECVAAGECGCCDGTFLKEKGQ